MLLNAERKVLKNIYNMLLFNKERRYKKIRMYSLFCAREMQEG